MLQACYVPPGLTHHHCHRYPIAKISLLAEAVFFASGVTTAVDAGSTGCTTYTDCWPFIQLDCVIACIFAVLLGKNIPRLCVPQLCVFLPGFLLDFSPT